jgi:hypothetical protein
MPFALTTASTIECPHKGKVTPSSSTKLTVGEKPVLLSNQWSAWTIEGCVNKTNTQTGTKECTKVATESGGEAAKLTVGGVAVLLGSAVAVSDGVPPAGPMSIEAGESKLQALE